MKKVVLCVFALLILTVLQLRAEDSRKWFISIESGAGTLAGLTAGHILDSRWSMGVGSGVDFSSFTVLEKNHSSVLLNVNIFAEYKFLNEDKAEISGRLKAGYDWLKVGTYGVSCFEVAPEILAGYRNMYVIFSGIVMFTEKTVFLPQIGAGYRFRI